MNNINTHLQSISGVSVFYLLGHKKYYMEIILMYLLGIILSILYLIKRDYGQFPKRLFILIMVFIIIIIFFLLDTKKSAGML